VAAPQAQLRVSRYFAVLAAIIVALYALVYFTGSGSLTDRLKPKLGLDLQGGATLTLEAKVKGADKPKREDLETARTILISRIDDKGVAEPEVLIDGDRNIVINVPGAGSEELNKVSDTAKMRFREVLQEVPDAGGVAPPSPTPSPTGSPKPTSSPKGKPNVKPGATTTPKAPGGGGAALAPTPSPTPSPSGSPSPAPADASDEAPTEAEVLKKIDPRLLQAAQQAQSPEQLLGDPRLKEPLEAVGKLTGEEIAVLPLELQLKIPTVTCETLQRRPVGSIDDEKKEVVACERDGHTKLKLDKSTVLGSDVDTADYNFDPAKGWKVDLSFKSSGQERWTALTKKALNKRVAVVLDNAVISAPTIQGVIAGKAEITGEFSQSEARDFASKLKFGALPLSFEKQDQSTISPTLGLASLQAGLLAGGIGLGLVILYSLIYYRALGLVTIASLVGSAVIIFASVILLGRQIGFTLTLAGVAGFIVAVGITADSFVVFFERLKDEVKEGRTMRTAVPRAWVRARRTILSADTVSFLAAATLYIFAIGAVQGFAFTLGLSTAVDVLIVFLFTHPLVALMARSKTFASPRMSGLGSLQEASAPAVPARAGRVSPKES
jgi:preprotein translocase subunit SecD